MAENQEKELTAYSLYSVQQKKRVKINPLEDIYPQLPNKKYQVIYADPPWDYGGKMQYDKSVIKDENEGFERKIFLSSAEFKYPTVKLKDLKKLDVASIASDDCLPSTATKPELLLVAVTDTSSVQDMVTSRIIKSSTANAGKTMEQAFLIFLSGMVGNSSF